MAAITKIELWEDVGFIDGAVEIPALAAADPTTPDITIEPTDPIVPSKDRFFSEVKLKEYYSELLKVSYMRITYDLKDSYGVDVPHTFWGWVDSVELVSDGSNPNTVIRWHIDEWRTWKSAITFGSGHIKRRPFIDLASTPIQNYSVRYYDIGTSNMKVIDTKTGKYHNNDECDVWWLIVSLNKKDAYNNTVTELVTSPIFMITDPGAIGPYYTIYNPDIPSPYIQRVRGTSFSQIYGGFLDEILTRCIGVTPDAVNGVWLSPMCPTIYDIQSGDGNYANPFSLVQGPYPGKSTNCYLESDNDEAYCFIRIFGIERTTAATKTFTALKSSEEERYILTAPDGSKLCELPYDYSVDSVAATLVLEPDGPYIEFSFKNSTYGNLVGVAVNSPLFECPLNSNAYTSYVYSGKQEYDREMRVVQSNANAWKNTTTQTAQGAMFGSFGPQGLALGVVGGLVGGLTAYGVEMIYQNDEEQRLEDRLQANQPSSLILSGNARLSAMRGYGYVLKSIVPDSYSATQITDTRSQFGVSVDELTTSCDVLIRTTATTGYYNIQNLIVTGDVPVSAKKWIREKFRSGVRLI